ncbi:MAG: hypothetical protein ABFC30_06575 [Proteiniphilum sp.]
MLVTLFNFLFNRSNRELYRQLAAKHHTTSWHVYRIAHGKQLTSMRDGCIYRELYRTGYLN